MNDYEERKYLSSTEAAKYLGVSVEKIHSLVRANKIGCIVSASGQKRLDLQDLKKYESSSPTRNVSNEKIEIPPESVLNINNTTQKIFVKNAMNMEELENDSTHLMVTSPPYFDAKMYTKEHIKDDLGDVHNLNEWFEKISAVWREVFRVLQPGRKSFINIMNLPIRDCGSFRSLNLVGRTIDEMVKIGFIFKRDIVWHKTHGVRAHFGTYPYPGGILINNMHEFILEFNKPNKKGFNKYGHVSKEQKAASKIDKEFWLSIKNTDVWVMKPQSSGDNRSHVAPFPYELPYRIIKAFSFVGETVLDPFLGSGTTLKASADLKRNGVGYEIVPEIAEAAIKNLSNFQGKLFD